MKSIPLILMSFFITLFMVSSVTAETYKYTDKNGSLVFTDDYSKLPENERQKTSKTPKYTNNSREKIIGKWVKVFQKNDEHIAIFENNTGYLYEQEVYDIYSKSDICTKSFFKWEKISDTDYLLILDSNNQRIAFTYNKDRDEIRINNAGRLIRARK